MKWDNEMVKSVKILGGKIVGDIAYFPKTIEEHLGTSVRDANVRTLMIGSIHGACLIFEGKHFRVENDPEETPAEEEYCASLTGYETEVCPSCGKEISIKWDINKNGFQAICPECGSRLMLCDACAHRHGEYHDDCDYCSKTDTCRFSRKAE